MLALLNPWVILGVLVALLGAGGSGYYYGGKHKENSLVAQEARDQQVVELARLGTAEEIAKIEIQNTTIRQKVEVQTREKVVYRECRHSDDVFGLLNSALEGSASLPAGSSVVPEADTPR